MDEERNSKKCKKCKKEKELYEFYKNEKWIDELCYDTWCKKCVEILIISETTARMYFDENRRYYPERHWSRVYTKNEIALDTKGTHLTRRFKQKFLNDKTREMIFKSINNTKFYSFIDFEKKDNIKPKHIEEREFEEKQLEIVEYIMDSDLESEKIRSDDDKVYSKRWHGNYTTDDIRYLEEYYNGLDNSFQLNNHSYIDYAMKVCKASLAMDNAFADMQMGVKDADKKYKNFKDIFDVLSQSAKFAEKTRTENDSSGLGSFGQLILKMENDGFLQKKIEFEDDDIDVVIREFKYILTSVGESF